MGDGGRTPLANGTDRELFVWNEQQSYLAYVLSRTFFCILLLLAEAECSPLDGMAARGINLLPRESSSLLAPRTNAKVNAVQIDNLKAKCVVCPTTNDFFLLYLLLVFCSVQHQLDGCRSWPFSCAYVFFPRSYFMHSTFFSYFLFISVVYFLHLFFC